MSKKSKKDKRKLVFITVGDMPDSYYQTPEAVKQALEDLQYELLVKEQPIIWSDLETGEQHIETEPWAEDDLRSLATGMVQAKLGWGKEAVSLRVTKKEAKELRKAKERNSQRNDPPKLADAPAEVQKDFAKADAALAESLGKTVEGFSLSHAAILPGGAPIAEPEEIRLDAVKLTDIAQAVSPTMVISLDGGETWSPPTVDAATEIEEWRASPRYAAALAKHLAEASAAYDPKPNEVPHGDSTIRHEL